MVKRIIADLLLKITPQKIIGIYNAPVINKYEYKLEYAQLSFSQEGEDLLLQRIFGKKNDGFYIDVGAHHPRRFSNTYIFYKKGWRGINIDPLPGTKAFFNSERLEDINLEIGISEKKGDLKYFKFNEPALNTFSEEEALKKASIYGNKIIGEQLIEVNTLEAILDEYLPKNKDVDFLSVDAEGLDMAVLKSINLNKYKPKLILTECLLLNSIDDILTNEVYQYLKAHNYILFSKTFNTLFFKLNE
jgi:FkbM family methyltransferase